MTTTPDTPYPLLTKAGFLSECKHADGYLEGHPSIHPDLPAIESHLASVIAERDEAQEHGEALGIAYDVANATITRLTQELEEAREARRCEGDDTFAINYLRTQNQQMREALEKIATGHDDIGPGLTPSAFMSFATLALNPSPSTEGGTE